MRVILIVVVVVLIATCLVWVREGRDFPLPQVLPMCDGRPVSPLYAVAGVILLILAARGLKRLWHPPDDE